MVSNFQSSAQMIFQGVMAIRPVGPGTTSPEFEAGQMRTNRPGARGAFSFCSMLQATKSGKSGRNQFWYRRHLGISSVLDDQEFWLNG